MTKVLYLPDFVIGVVEGGGSTSSIRSPVRESSDW